MIWSPWTGMSPELSGLTSHLSSMNSTECIILTGLPYTENHHRKSNLVRLGVEIGDSNIDMLAIRPLNARNCIEKRR